MKKKVVRIIIVLTMILTLGLATTPAIAVPAKVWHVPEDFATIQEAIDSPSVVNGDSIMVGPGNNDGAEVTKSVIIKGKGGAVIDSGPMHPAGLSQGFRLLAGSDGAVIRNLIFTTDLSIMNGEAVDDVTVTQCTFLSSIQAISNWRGSGWEISHNKIIDLRTRCGGGIGILIADYTGGDVENNVVKLNNISGTLYVSSGDCGGYDGSGIVLYADFRWGRLGADEIKNNQVLKNKVSIESNNPTVVDFNAFELTDSRDDVNADPFPVIYGNTIAYNDFRGTESPLLITPDGLEGLEGYNTFWKNLGDNRGEGPAGFNPVGN